MTRRIAISVGHGERIRGASASPNPEPFNDEVNECVKIVDRVHQLLTGAGHACVKYFDTVSTSQSENLNRITSWHNQQSRDLDVSCHLNASSKTSSPMGCEVLYVTQENLADDVSAALAAAGHFKDRGPKYRSDLAFLNNTSKPAILLECWFCDSSADCANGRAYREAICKAIAESIADVQLDIVPPEPEEPPVEPEEPPPVISGENYVEITTQVQGHIATYVNGTLVRGDADCTDVVRYTIKLVGDVTLTINGEEFHNAPPAAEEPLLEIAGRCSWFGGPEDTGVSPDEGLAFIYDYETRPDLFLPQQPPGTTGLARRLNPNVHYVACRWDYNVTPKEMLAKKELQALVRANGREFRAWPADWGPHEDTGRVADISYGLMVALGIETDDQVEVIYPV